MKIKFLMAGLLGFVSATTFAQKSELNNAQTQFDKYETMRGTQAMMQMATTSLNDAKTAIDKAAANEKTAAMPQTYALKGAIYSSLALKDSVGTTSLPLYNTAQDALKKAKEADTKGDYKKLIDNANLNLAQYQLSIGVKQYQGGHYDVAYKAFDAYRTILPEDTNAIYYTALAAANSQNYTAAITNYKKLVTTNYSKKQAIYKDMASAYLYNKDTTGAVSALNEGISKYPNDPDMRREEIEIGLQQGKQNEIVEKTLAAIKNDPKNKTLYYYAGLAYSGMAEGIKPGSGKDAAAKATATQTRNDDYAKAADMYRKALELDPNYYEANLNLGYVLMSPAIDMYNAANKLPTTKQKEYDAALVKVNAQADKAKPYLEKALESHPDSEIGLSNLKNYYLIKKDNVHAAEITKKLNAAHH